MSVYYLRHELLRHESVRQFSMLNVDDMNKNEYAAMGFYADMNLQAFICFSCHFFVKFRSLKNPLHFLHSEKSKGCPFLDGRDVSIKPPRYYPDYNTVQIAGSPNFKDQKWYSRPIEKHVSDLILQTRTLDNPQLLYINSYAKPNFGVLYLPIYIPPIKHSNRVFHIESFFVSMRSEERRIETFKLKLYPFPYNECIKNLTENGFFYTLLNSTIQCAFCRIIITNITPRDDIKWIHDVVGKDCKFVIGDDVGNVKFAEKKYTTIETDIDQIQCKICLINQVNIVYNCGHLICSDCTLNLTHCQICRGSITSKMRIYFN